MPLWAWPAAIERTLRPTTNFVPVGTNEQTKGSCTGSQSQRTLKSLKLRKVLLSPAQLHSKPPPNCPNCRPSHSFFGRQAAHPSPSTPWLFCEHKDVLACVASVVPRSFKPSGLLGPTAKASCAAHLLKTKLRRSSSATAAALSFGIRCRLKTPLLLRPQSRNWV